MEKLVVQTQIRVLEAVKEALVHCMTVPHVGYMLDANINKLKKEIS